MRRSRTKRQSWKPRAGIKADDVFREALANAKAGRYAEALAKHIWFHEHALDHERSLYGVRLSYALSAWLRLAECYPPALRALIRVRNRAARRVKAGTTVWNEFADFRAINEKLNDAKRTIRLFKWLVTHNRKGAEDVYHLVEENLFDQGESQECNQFLKTANFESIRRGYRADIRLSKEPEFGADFARDALDRFGKRTRRLIHLLAANGRAREARAVMVRAQRLFKSKKLNFEMKQILNTVQ